MQQLQSCGSGGRAQPRQQQQQQPQQRRHQHASSLRAASLNRPVYTGPSVNKQEQQQQQLEQQQQQLASLPPSQQWVPLPPPDQQQQQRQQRQQRQALPLPIAAPMLPPDVQHHASVLASAWGETERRAALSALVKSADSVDGLAAVWLTLRSNAGPAELAVLFNRLGAVCEPRQMSAKGLNTAKALLRELLIASEDRMPAMAGPEFVYIIGALAKLRAAPDTAWLNRWLAVSRHRLARLSPTQLVLCVRALYRLDMKPADVRSCIAFPAWMHNLLASLAPRLDALSGFDQVKLVLALSDLGYKPSRGFLNTLAAAVESKLPGLDSVYLAGLLGGFSGLKYEPPPGFMRSVLGEVYAKLPLFDDKDLAAALSAFCSMRRCLRGELLADFVAQVAGKLPTFSTRALAGVVAALGQLAYRPGPEWCAAVTGALRGQLLGARPHTVAITAWGLAGCGYDAEPWFVDELMAAASPNLAHWDLADVVMLAQAMASFSHRPAPGSASHTSRLRFFERLCYTISQRPLHPKHALLLLESMCACDVPPDALTTDHLVVQLVQGGLQHAPVSRVAGVLQVLAAARHTPGKHLLKDYAQCIRGVSTALSAAQLAGAVSCLAANGFTPDTWWLVQILAIAHARVTEFDAASAAALLSGAAALCSRTHSKLPSNKWVGDFGSRFWDQLPHAAAGGSDGGAAAPVPPQQAAAGGAPVSGPRQQQQQQQQRNPRMQQQQSQQQLSGEQLAQGLWGSVSVGFAPSEAQWAAWEAAAGQLGWALPLEAAQQAVLAYQRSGRLMPRTLSAALQGVQDAERSARRAEVEAAAAARAAAAAQLAQQQERMAAAMAVVVAHQQQQPQPQPQAGV